MSDITIGLLSALLATNQPQAVSNLVQQQTGISVPIKDESDPVEQELQNLMIADDAAVADVNALISTNQIPRSDTNATAAFQSKINARLNEVKDGYKSFLLYLNFFVYGYIVY